MVDETNYVTQATWLRAAGRPDLVDEIADQFERPATTLEMTLETGTDWPRRSRGWRSAGRLHPHPAPERVAG